MRPVVGFPSYTAGSTAAGSGWSSDYPAENLVDLTLPSKVGRASGGAQVTISGVGAYGLVTLVNHTLPAGAVVTAGGRSVTVPPRARRLPACLPIEVSGSGSVSISVAGAGSFELGGVDVAAVWEWPGVSPGREFGIGSKGSSTPRPGGSTEAPVEDWKPRIYTGQIDYVDDAFQQEALDFLRSTDLDSPFVWVQDLDTPASWARTCFLARNRDLNPLSGAMYRHDQFRFGFVEHMR